MNDTRSPDPASAASRLLGVEPLFWELVRLIGAREGRAALTSDPAVQERLRALHARFSRECAAVVEQHLGPEQAARSLAALDSPLVQRFVAARRRMAPGIAAELQALEKRIGALDL